MSQKTENTNLASEFYVISMLHRIGLNPILTIANKKFIDIILLTKDKVVTIDVKGLIGKTSWLLGKKRPSTKNNLHYYILVTYLNRIADPLYLPECFILPSKEIGKYTHKSKKGFVIRYSELRINGCQFRGDWSILNSRRLPSRSS